MKRTSQELSAKEMFEELGFIDCQRQAMMDINSNHITEHLIYVDYSGYSKVIFNLIDDAYILYRCEASVKLHEAITLQMKELGWIE